MGVLRRNRSLMKKKKVCWGIRLPLIPPNRWTQQTAGRQWRTQGDESGCWSVKYLTTTREAVSGLRVGRGCCNMPGDQRGWLVGCAAVETLVDGLHEAPPYTIHQASKQCVGRVESYNGWHAWLHYRESLLINKDAHLSIILRDWITNYCIWPVWNNIHYDVLKVMKLSSLIAWVCSVITTNICW